MVNLKWKVYNTHTKEEKKLNTTIVYRMLNATLSRIRNLHLKHRIFISIRVG